MCESTVDIIIPVYNKANTLERCLNSILDQTYKHFRCLVIDDGSIDNSLAICSSIKLKDHRVFVFSQDNQGVSSARNHGLSIVQSDWILFVDADDYLSPVALENLMLLSENADIIIPDIVAVNGEGTVYRRQHFDKAILKDDSFSELFTRYNFQRKTAIGGKLFRSSVVQNSHLRFDVNVRHAEDLIFIYQFLLCCKAIAMTGKPDYFYVIDSTSSLSKTINSFQTEYYGYKKIMSVTQLLARSLEAHGCIREDYFSWPLINAIIRCLNAVYHANPQLNKAERLRLIRSLDINYYSKHRSITNDIKMRFLDFVLCDLRWIQLYDFIRAVKQKISS